MKGAGAAVGAALTGCIPRKRDLRKFSASSVPHEHTSPWSAPLRIYIQHGQ